MNPELIRFRKKFDQARRHLINSGRISTDTNLQNFITEEGEWMAGTPPEVKRQAWISAALDSESD